MICQNCGALMPEGSKFCTKCGESAGTGGPANGAASYGAAVSDVPDPGVAEIDVPDPGAQLSEQAPTEQAPAPNILSQLPEPNMPSQVLGQPLMLHPEPPEPTQILHQAMPQNRSGLPEPSDEQQTSELYTSQQTTVPYAPPQPPTEQTPAKAGLLRSVGRNTASIALCIVVFALLCACFALYILRDTIVSAPDLIVKTDLSRIADKTGLTETVLEQINPRVLQEYRIDAESVDKLLSRSGINDALSTVVSDYIDAIRDGDLSYHISARDLVRLLKRYESLIRDEFGYVITDRDYELIEEYLRDVVELEEYSAGALLEIAEVPAELPTLAVSPLPLITAAILCAVLIFDVFAVNRKRIRCAFMHLGVTAGLAGVAYTLVSFILPGMVPSVLRNIIFAPPLDISLRILIFGVTALVAGILSIVVYVLIHILAKTPAPRAAGRSAGFMIAVISVHVILILSLSILAPLTIRELPAEWSPVLNSSQEG